MFVHPAVIDVAPNKAVDGVPSSVSVTFESLTTVSAEPGTSAAVIVSQPGASETAPVPSCRKNLRVVVMLPVNVDSVLLPLE